MTRAGVGKPSPAFILPLEYQMRPAYTLTAAPATEPITYDQAAEHLRVDSADDIAYITALIPAAREYIDSVTGRVSVLSSWKCTACTWGDLMEGYVVNDWRGAPTMWCNPVNGNGLIAMAKLFRAPLVAVQSVSYYAPGASSLTTMSGSLYRAITGYEPGLIQFTGDIPSLDDRPDAIQIAFTAGYATASETPAVLKHAIKIMVAHFYETRTPIAFAIPSEIPFTLSNLIAHQKLAGWIA